MLGPEHFNVQGAQIGLETLAREGGDLPGIEDIAEILQLQVFPFMVLVEPAAAHERMFPEDILIVLCHDQVEFFPGRVPEHQKNFLQPADMVGVGVGDQDVGEVRDRPAQLEQGLGRLGPAVDQKVRAAFNDEQIGLVVKLGKSRADTDKKYFQSARVGKREDFSFPFSSSHTI